MEWTIFNKQKLLHDLKRFGLNPKEWNLSTPIAGDKQPQVLRHINDNDFKLLGIPLAHGRLLKWEKIQILSI